jgi:hypothetical protein
MNEEQGSAGMMRLFGQFFMIPIAAFVRAFGMLFETMQGMERAVATGMDVMAGSQVPRNESPAAVAAPTKVAEPEPAAMVGVSNVTTAKTETTHKKEENLLSTDGNSANGLDKDLHDDMLKLVRYKVLFVRREYEVAFPEKEDLVSDNMDGSAFTAWKIAEFIQDLAKNQTPVPGKWADKNYPKDFVEPADDFEHGHLTGIPHEDKKYLRVYYEVLERYPREKFKYEEQQIKVLEEIRDEMKKPSQAAAAGGSDAAKPSKK